MFVAAELLKKDNKVNFDVGTHHVEGRLVVNVKAVVTRSPDTTSKPTANLLCRNTIAHFLSRCGATQNAVLAALEATWEAALSGGEPREVSEETQARVDVALAKFDRMVDKLPRSPKKGGCKVAGTLEIIEPMKEAA